MKNFVLCLVAFVLTAVCLSPARAAHPLRPWLDESPSASCAGGACASCPAAPAVVQAPALPPAGAKAPAGPAMTSPRLILPKLLPARRHHLLPRRR